PLAMNLDAALSTFVQECRDLLQEMEQAALQLERDPKNAEAINAMFRPAHTIKGSAGLFGLDNIVAFAHAFESVLDRVRAGEVQIGPGTIALLLMGCDHIGELVEAVAEGRGDGDVALHRGQEVLRNLSG